MCQYIYILYSFSFSPVSLQINKNSQAPSKSSNGERKRWIHDPTSEYAHLKIYYIRVCMSMCTSTSIYTYAYFINLYVCNHVCAAKFLHFFPHTCIVVKPAGDRDLLHIPSFHSQACTHTTYIHIYVHTYTRTPTTQVAHKVLGRKMKLKMLEKCSWCTHAHMYVYTCTYACTRVCLNLHLR